MRKYQVTLLTLLLFIGAAYFCAYAIHAQGAQAATFQGGGLHTTCTAPATGSYFLCMATDGIWVSNNGGAYFQIQPPSSAVAGITSISVNGGTPCLGPTCSLTIPTKAISSTTSTTTTTIQ